jgi:2'-5' RNA ligase
LDDTARVPRRRLGVALLVPPPADAAVDALRAGLGDPALGRIPAHLTLVPPVNVREDALGDALAVVRHAAAGASGPLALTLGPVTTFLPDNPVAYLAVSGDVDGLVALRDRVFREPLDRPLTWPFVPHVTVADEAPVARIEAAVAALDSFTLDVVFAHVHVLEEGAGRVWTPIADATLGQSPKTGHGLPVEVAVSATPPPDAATLLGPSVTATARRDGTVVGVLVAFGDDIVRLELAEGHEDVEPHLRRALRQRTGP